ncbi:hypothetical protein [Oceanobacillus sp. FSL W7-1293]|uniref:hypothetical protein n=1 Tax=Oceanobacillus sp. FSL W7-1293 TaxID=2921699 RepID=UPI0030CC9789
MQETQDSTFSSKENLAFTNALVGTGTAVTRPIENICTSESGVVGRSGAMHHHQFQKVRIFHQNASKVMENMFTLE